MGRGCMRILFIFRNLKIENLTPSCLQYSTECLRSGFLVVVLTLVGGAIAQIRKQFGLMDQVKSRVIYPTGSNSLCETHPQYYGPGETCAGYGMLTDVRLGFMAMKITNVGGRGEYYLDVGGEAPTPNPEEFNARRQSLRQE